MSHGRPRRNTMQRRVVLEELRRVTSHPTAVELYELVRRQLPKISLGTVYRNLDLLSRVGAIQKLDLGGSEARFDGDLRRHLHVRCVRCGKVDDLGSPLPDSGDSVAPEPLDSGGYHILGYRLEYIGVCPRCGAAEANPPSGPMDKQREVEYEPVSGEPGKEPSHSERSEESP